MQKKTTMHTWEINGDSYSYIQTQLDISSVYHSDNDIGYF